METEKLKPILNKESILKTANSEEIRLHPAEVMARYSEYAGTHIPLGDTTEQLNKLKRVITVNVKCAVGTIVGPYGYGKTSTAVHLWHETRNQKILSVPPFVWNNLDQLITGVYHWVDYELGNGAAQFRPGLKKLYEKISSMALTTLMNDLHLLQEQVDSMRERGVLNLELRALDVVNFFDEVSQLVLQAGYSGMVIYTDELQATLSNYSTRDLFFSHLFDMVSNLLDRPGKWAWIMTMNEDVEATIHVHRNDLLQRLQASALHFRVERIYSNIDYPRTLWREFEKLFGFDGSKVITEDTLVSIGQIASRKDLGAGPRMVTHAMARGIGHYESSGNAYTPFNLVEDYLGDKIIFDSLGKFPKGTQDALNHVSVKNNSEREQLVKLIAAFPLGLSEQKMTQYELQKAFEEFPPLARNELLQQMAGGYILRALSEVLTPPETIVETLTKNFVNAYTPGKKYAIEAANAFYKLFVESILFNKDWDLSTAKILGHNGESYISSVATGSYDKKFPERSIHVMVTAVGASKTPNFEKVNAQADMEYRFEFNFGLSPEESSRMLVDPATERVVVFQLNLNTVDPALAENTLPAFLLPFYNINQFTPLLTMSLAYYLDKNKGTEPINKSQVDMVTSNISPYFQKLLLGAGLLSSDPAYANAAVGPVKIQELFKQQCRKLFPQYTALAITKNWENHLARYNNALQRLENGEGLSVIRGRAELRVTKADLADYFQVVGKSLTMLENLLNELKSMNLVELVNYAGASPTSVVTIKLLVHPFERKILDLIESSSDTIRLKGDTVPAVEVTQVIKDGRKIGYTNNEVARLIELLKFRKWIQVEERSGKLYRLIDDINELRESQIKLCEKIEADARKIDEHYTDFNPEPYYMTRTIEDLRKAEDRDRVESIKERVREREAGLRSFIYHHSAADLQQFSDLITKAQNVAQSQLDWLNKPMSESAIKGLLEIYRSSKANEYTRLVEKARALKERAQRNRISEAREAEQLIEHHKRLGEIRQEMTTIETQVRSFNETRRALDEWQQVSRYVAEVYAKARAISEKHQDPAYLQRLDQLVKLLEQEQQSDPFGFYLNALSIRARFEAIAKSIDSWEATHRKAFVEHCAQYQRLLEAHGIRSNLTGIPFDAENASRSHEMLFSSVTAAIQAEIKSQESALERVSSRIKYGRLIQNLDMRPVEQVTQDLQAEIQAIKSADSRQTIENPGNLGNALLAPLTRLKANTQELTAIVNDLVKRRPAEGFELQFQQALERNRSGSRADLRTIIIDLMENKSASDQESILQALISLFHKNQLIVEITPTGGEE